MALDLETEAWKIADSISKGKLVFFLGAGVHMCGRPKDEPWRPGRFLPKADELARLLAALNGPQYLEKERRADLARIAQHTVLQRSPETLYSELHRVFDADYPPTLVHQFLAQLPRNLRNSGRSETNFLAVTTNYDDVLETALRETETPFDLCVYIAEEPDRGHFIHVNPPSGAPLVIAQPETYRNLSIANRCAVLKVHGSVARGRDDAQADNYVITEDDYLYYLLRSHPSEIFPATLIAKIRTSEILFLGYGLGDWNLRVLFHQIWSEQRLKTKSWAIQLKPDEMSEQFWGQHGVQIIDSDLEQFMGVLTRQLKSSLGAGQAA